MIYVISTSIGHYQDSHKIRILNYLPEKSDKYCFISDKNGKFEEYDVIGIEQKLNKNYSTLKKYSYRWFENNLRYRLMFPDRFAGWSSILYKNLINKINDNDTIITASGSFEAHLFGLKVKKHKPTVKWISDFGDPWYNVEKKQRPWFSYIAKYLEKKIIQYSDAVIVTTDTTKKLFENLYKANNIKVIYYGYTEKFKNISNNTKNIITGQIGSGHLNNRNFLPFLRALEKFPEKYDVYMAGARSKAFDDFILNNKNMKLISHQTIDYNESINMLRKFDIIPIVGNKSDDQIPGKVFVCAAIAIPILYIKQSNNDPALTFLSELDGVLICDNNLGDIEKALEYYFDNKSKLFEMSKLRLEKNFLDNYSRKNNSKYLEKIISEL